MENWLHKRVLLSPNKVALHYQNQVLTFRQLANEVDQWAAKLTGYLRNAAVQQPIGILGSNNKVTYELILAVQQLGHPLALFNSRLSPDELAQQIEDAAPILLLKDDALVNQLQVSTSVMTYLQLSQRSKKSFKAVMTFPSDRVTDIMYTSGSTGRPKGVLQTFGNHFYSAIGTGLNFNLTENDAWLCVVPLFHISGLSIMMRSLIYGLSVYLEPKFDAQRINRLLKEQPITIISVVPYMLKQLLKNLEPTAHYQTHFKCFFLGGGPIDESTLAYCRGRKLPVALSYGMTETASNVVALNFKDAFKKLGSAGQALFPVQVRIDPRHPNLGEIQLKTPTLAKSYLHQSAAYVQKYTADGWFRTGDVGYLDKDGFLFIKGRLDTMFISGGENIFPNEIENAYSGLPEIKEIIVSHKPDLKWGAVPIALIVFQTNQRLNNSELTQFGRQHLAHYKVPVNFFALEELPKTGNGKIDYRAIKRLLEDKKRLTTLKKL